MSRRPIILIVLALGAVVGLRPEEPVLADAGLEMRRIELEVGGRVTEVVPADVDGDNHVEIVLGHGGGDANIGAITVYGDADNTWPPGRKIWNQHAYNITNVIRVV